MSKHSSNSKKRRVRVNLATKVAIPSDLERQCAGCGEFFTPSSEGQMVCEDACRPLANHVRSTAEEHFAERARTYPGLGQVPRPTQINPRLPNPLTWVVTDADLRDWVNTPR